MATEVFSFFRDPAKKVVSGNKVATLLIPDGDWVIVGKVVVDNDNTTTVQSLTARLNAGVHFDTNYARLGPSGTQSVDKMVLAFTVVASFPGSSNQAQNAIDLVITLDPVGPNALVNAAQIKIIAIPVAHIHFPEQTN